MGVGKVIKSIRKEKNYTLKQVEEKSGLSKSYISEISNEIQDMPLRTLIKIADALDVSASYIMERSEIEYGRKTSDNEDSLQALLKILQGFDSWPQKDREEIIDFCKKVKEIKDSRK